MENPEFLQINLKKYMDGKGWSYKKFALESKVSYHTIYRAISEGVIPRGGNINKMAIALGVTIADLWANPQKQKTEAKEFVTLSDLAKGDAKILERLERLENRIPDRAPSSPDLQRIWSFWRGAGPVTRSACLYLLSGTDEDLRKVHEDIRGEVRALRKHIPGLRALKSSRE